MYVYIYIYTYHIISYHIISYHIISYHIIYIYTYITMVTYEWGLKRPWLWEHDLSVLCMEHGCRIGCCFLKSLVALDQWRIPVWRLRCWTVPSKVRDVRRVVVCVWDFRPKSSKVWNLSLLKNPTAVSRFVTPPGILLTYCQ